MLIYLTSLLDITSPFEKSRPRDLYTSKPVEYNMGKATPVVIIQPLSPYVTYVQRPGHPSKY